MHLMRVNTGDYPNDRSCVLLDVARRSVGELRIEDRAKKFGDNRHHCPLSSLRDIVVGVNFESSLLEKLRQRRRQGFE